MIHDTDSTFIPSEHISTTCFFATASTKKTIGSTMVDQRISGWVIVVSRSMDSIQNSIIDSRYQSCYINRMKLSSDLGAFELQMMISIPIDSLLCGVPRYSPQPPVVL